MGELQVTWKVLGPVSTNVYLAVNTRTREAFLVDPADRADLIEAWISDENVKVTAILLTHGHFDHIGAVNELKKRYQAPVYAMEAERVLLEDPALNLSGSWASAVTVKPDRLLQDGDEFCAAGVDIRAYHTPGHTKGGACYYLPQEHVLFSGDTIFCESIGRADFPTGSARALVDSVRRMTQLLPEETRVYPGHDMETSIAHEKAYNPYI